MTKKTWNVTLTPAGRPATTLTGVPHDEMVRSLFELMYGSGEFTPRATVAEAPADELRRAA